MTSTQSSNQAQDDLVLAIKNELINEQLASIQSDFDDILNSSNTISLHSLLMTNNLKKFRIVLGLKLVDVDAVDTNGDTVLMIATRYVNKNEYIKLLINANANVNLKNFVGNSALHIAAYDIEMCELLINAGADINVFNNLNESILMHAISRNCLKVVELLIEKGANLNHQNDRGNTALHVTVSNGSSIIIKMLLDAGADHRIKNNNGSKAKDIAGNSLRKIIDNHKKAQWKKSLDEHVIQINDLKQQLAESQAEKMLLVEKIKQALMN